MIKRTLIQALCVASVMTTTVYAKQGVNPCLNNMDNQIGTLYLCGFGGKFKVLSLDRCSLEDKDIPAIAAYLDAHPRINALDIGQNQLGDEGMAALAKNRTLAWLNVSYNDNIGDKGAAAIAQIATLTDLDMVADNVGPQGAIALASLPLRAINLTRNHIGPEGGRALARSNTLQIAYLDTNEIGTEAAAEFGKNTSLTHLYIGWNKIGDAAAIAIAGNKTIVDIGLEYNNIGNPGALALATNTTLRWLYIFNNHIGPTGIAALEKNTTLVEVSVEDNDGTTVKRRGFVKFVKPQRSESQAEMSERCANQL